MGKVLDGPHNADFSLKILFLGLDKLTIPISYSSVYPLHVTLQRCYPSVTLTNQGQAIFFAEEQPTVRSSWKVFRHHITGQGCCSVEIEGLARWVIAALIVPFCQLQQEITIDPAKERDCRVKPKNINCKQNK